MLKSAFFLLAAVVLMTACGNSRTSQAVLEQKLDSIRKLELKRQMKLKGIDLENVSPIQLFYDSLQLQPLPLGYTELYVQTLPGFTMVPTSIAVYLDLEGRGAPRAIALPETLNARLMLLAADQDDGEYELWLYSLDDSYMPVDKLLLYEPSRFTENKLSKDERDVYFSIDSHCEINVVEYADDSDLRGQLSTYIVDDSRQFVEKRNQ